MVRKTALTTFGIFALLLVVGGSGCTFPLDTMCGPGQQLPIPTPISPWLQDKMEDRYWETERYKRVPILGPITAGGPPVALDPPTPDEIWRALLETRTVEGGLPFLWERQLNNARMTVELIGDYIDPPRVYPLIGPAQLHHANYKCTVFYTEVTRVGWPVPYTTVDEEASEVIYIDHAHFHRLDATEEVPPPGAPNP
jgi:hypothetical protein